MHDEYIKLLQTLFPVIEKFVLSSSGDGDGYVISKDYIEIANLFEQYEKANDNWFSEKHIDEKFVSFCHDQEGIVFCADESLVPPWQVDIIVKL